MTSRLCVAVSGLLSVTLLANALPAKAQKGTSNPTIPSIHPAPLPVLPPLPRIPFVLPSVPQSAPSARVPAKPIVVTELVERLRTAYANERQDIIRQLSDSQQAIIPALVKALDDPDPLVKSGVAEVLGNRTDESIPAPRALVEMTRDPRRAIVTTSSFLTLPPAPLPFFASSEGRRYPPTPPNNPGNLLRVTAIVALGKIGLPARDSATAPLIQALQVPDPWVRLNATWALAEIGAPVPLLSHWLEALESPDPDLRRSAGNVFQDSRSLLRKVLGAEANDTTAPRLVAVLKDDDDTVREAAGQALGLLGIEALPTLVQALTASEPIVRLEAAKLIGDLGAAAQSAVPALVAQLDDTGQYVPPTANPYGLVPLPPLITFPMNYPYPPTPANPKQLVRGNAAIALGQLGDRGAVPALTARLKDDSPWMQLATGWALLVLGQKQGLPVVGRLLQHPDPSIQAAALTQLEGYGVQSAPYVLPYYGTRLDLKDDNQRNGAIIRVGQYGAAALGLLPKLRTLLSGNQKNSPGYAATALGQIAQSTAIAWRNGSLSSSQRNQAIAELTKVMAIMEAPMARFNRQPVDRVRNAIATLKSAVPS